MTTRLLVLWEASADPAAFERHYREVHIPLAKTIPGLRRYTIGRNAAPVSGDAYHWVAELDFADMAAFQAGFSSPEGQATGADASALAARLGVARRAMVYEVEEV